MRRIKPIGILIESAFRIAAVVVLSTLCCIGGKVFAAETPLKDTAISDAVENAFRKDTAVPSFRIEITTTDGIVILKGSVDNILAKERAARVAEVVKGVRAVVNKIEVAWPVLRTDRRMQEDVTDALIEDPAAEVSDIHIQVKDGIAILSGIADTWQEQRLYGRVAKGCQGGAESRQPNRSRMAGIAYGPRDTRGSRGGPGVGCIGRSCPHRRGG